VPGFFQDRLQTASLQQRPFADLSTYSKQRLGRHVRGLSERELLRIIEQTIKEDITAAQGDNLLDKFLQGAIKTLRDAIAPDPLRSLVKDCSGSTLSGGMLDMMWMWDGFAHPSFDALLDLLARVWRQLLCLGRHPFNFIIYEPGLKRPMLSFPVDLPGHGRFSLPTTFSHSFASTANFIILVAPPLFLCYPPIKVCHHSVVCHIQRLLDHSQACV
jgi:hypothetical protein